MTVTTKRVFINVSNPQPTQAEWGIVRLTIVVFKRFYLVEKERNLRSKCSKGFDKKQENTGAYYKPKILSSSAARLSLRMLTKA